MELSASITLQNRLAPRYVHIKSLRCISTNQYLEHRYGNCHAYDVIQPIIFLFQFYTNTAPRLRGFIIFDYESQYNEARKELAKWISEGKVQRKETIVKGGLKSAEETLLGFYTGMNTGTFFLPCYLCFSNSSME